MDRDKVVVKHQGRPVVCLNLKYGGTYFLCNCDKTSNQYKVTTLMAAKKKWEAEKEA